MVLFKTSEMVNGVDLVLTGVSKTWTRRGKKTRFHRAKKWLWKVYGYRNGIFTSFTIHPVKVPYYKSQIKRFRLFKCPECARKFKCIKGSKLHCPYCT